MKTFGTVLISVAFLLFWLGDKPTDAFDKNDLQRLKTTNSCTSCDLRAANLNWADLREANLAHTDLRKAQLFMANLRGVNLTGANITNAVFEEANLSNVIWVDGKKCALRSVGQCD